MGPPCTTNHPAGPALGAAIGADWRDGHLNGMAVKAGDEVVLGQKIGRIGDTGGAIGCPLHFAVKSVPAVWGLLEFIPDPFANKSLRHPQVLH